MDSYIEKIVGYVMLAVGLIFILFAVYNVYSVFTAAAVPPEMFKMENIAFNVTNSAGFTNSVDLGSGKLAGKMLDMGAWYTLMFFLVYAGGKIASLGIQMAKGIRGLAKTKDELSGFSG